jgi:hypothetical protein
MRYACRTGYHERCPGRWCTCSCHPQLRATEWTRLSGTTNAPSAAEEAEALELGRQWRCTAATSRSCSTTPPTTPEEAAMTQR